MPKTSTPKTNSNLKKTASIATPELTANALGAGGAQAMAGKEDAASPMTPKNFRNHPDMENFFRFIYENDLRHEALQIIDEIILDRRDKKAKKI